MLKACVDCGTDYADITGETMPYVRDSIRDYDALAKEHGARIVHCSGYDSVPSDLLARKALKTIRAKNQTDQVRIIIGADADKTDGAASGGTLASGIGIIEYLMANKHELKDMKNPYMLGGEPEGITEERKAAQKDVKMFGYSPSLQAWYCPFIMAGCNTRVVRRSMAGLNCDY